MQAEQSAEVTLPAVTAVPVVFLSRAMTRGDVLKFAIAFALRRARKVVRGLTDGLTESERYAVAEHVCRSCKSTVTPGTYQMRPSRSEDRQLKPPWTCRGTFVIRSPAWLS